ncbi:hypothetical protein JCM10914A_05190 [Paenibacillus sp. JCM 10914]
MMRGVERYGCDFFRTASRAQEKGAADEYKQATRYFGDNNGKDKSGSNMHLGCTRNSSHHSKSEMFIMKARND